MSKNQKNLQHLHSPLELPPEKYNPKSTQPNKWQASIAMEIQHRKDPSTILQISFPTVQCPSGNLEMGQETQEIANPNTSIISGLT